MPTVNSVQYANVLATPQVLEPGVFGGQLRNYFADVPLGGQAAGEVIPLFVLPYGFRPVRFTLISTDIVAATIAIGTAASTARFAAAAALAAADTLYDRIKAAEHLQQLAADTLVQALTAGAALPTNANGRLRISCVGVAPG